MTTTDTASPTTSRQPGSDGSRLIFGVSGLIALVLGVLVLFAPGASAGAAIMIVAVLLGAYAITTGIVYLGVSIFSKGIGGWSRVGHALLGVLYIVGGVLILSNLLLSGVVATVFLTVTIGLLWLFEGVFALVLLSRSDNKVWTVVYAILSIIAGGMLMFSPLLGAVTLWWLFGISMLVLGIAQIMRAFRAGAEG